MPSPGNREPGIARRTVPATKRPFDIDEAMSRIREAVRPFPPAALFQLADEGFDSPFEVLVACMISIRTFDEVTVPTARRFFSRARTARDVAHLTPAEINQLIRTTTFHEPKARQIHAIARRLAADYDGELPCDERLLRSLPGVGPKCASLVLGIACGIPRIAVDVHVHRVTNRWGYVRTRTPEQTMTALEEKLPKRYWVEINRLLVPFGKHVCTGRAPRCSVCVVLDMCQQAGVTTHR
uniref:Endonuclease III n=1 Tax=Thermorudis peleae TaxID=1382356 RepID=A0A831THX6_9BACT